MKELKLMNFSPLPLTDDFIPVVHHIKDFIIHGVRWVSVRSAGSVVQIDRG